MEKRLEALFYILVFIYSTSHRKLAFAEWFFFQVEQYLVNFTLKKANQLKWALSNRTPTPTHRHPAHSSPPTPIHPKPPKIFSEK